MQARGDPAAFLEHLETGLALVRQVRHLEPSPLYPHAVSAELDLLRGVERWLERLDGRPDLLRRALELLRRHEQATVKEGDNALRADYLVAMNAVKVAGGPDSWACRVLRSQHADGNLLAGLTAASWKTPWEEARLQRLIRQLANEGAVAHPLPPPLTRKLLFPGYQSQNSYASLQDTTRVQARELMVALRLFQVEAGRPARTLEELTPNILPAVPIDRATGQPVGYRLAGGDKGPAGQGTLTIKGETFRVPLPPQK